MTNTSATGPPGPGPGTPTTTSAEIHWHLAEVAAILRQEPRPLRPELLRIVLRGVGELCRMLFERGHETPAEPPFLFRNDPVVAEALGMWDQRLRAAMSGQRSAGAG